MKNIQISGGGANHPHSDYAPEPPWGFAPRPGHFPADNLWIRLRFSFKAKARTKTQILYLKRGKKRGTSQSVDVARIFTGGVRALMDVVSFSDLGCYRGLRKQKFHDKSACELYSTGTPEKYETNIRGSSHK